MALENAINVAMREAVEQSRPDPVVEFARKKSPAPSVESGGMHPTTSSYGSKARELFPAFPSFPQVSLPRDRRRPLLTPGEGRGSQALEAYRSLRTRLLKSQAAQGFRSIVITSVGKSEGKTTTAFNLAFCCAQVEGLSVLLIDGDLQSRSLTQLIPGLPLIGLTDVMNGRAACEDAIVKTDLPNLYVMGAGKSDVAGAELFSSEGWRDLIHWSSQHFKIMLIDALSMSASADFELLAPACNGVLLVVRARSTPREALKLAIQQIDADKLIGIVGNGFSS